MNDGLKALSGVHDFVSDQVQCGFEEWIVLRDGGRGKVGAENGESTLVMLWKYARMEKKKNTTVPCFR